MFEYYVEVGDVFDEFKFVIFEGLLFQFYQLYLFVGDQLIVIDMFVEGVGDGFVFQMLFGVMGLGKIFMMVNMIVWFGCLVIVFVLNKMFVVQFYVEFCEFFLCNVVEYFVLYYDYYQFEVYVLQCDLFIEKDLLINEYIEQMWLLVMKSLMECCDVVIVVIVLVIYGIGNLFEYYQMILMLCMGDKFGQCDVIVWLIVM